jgi:2-polyprenyl-6-methoxyphenol hydroxylase-like FAD-dependent oxidoreductase
MAHDTRAVVLGGGMAGLLAARVLADRYPEVTVVDRDDLAVPDPERRGVPQGRHAHVLLARGQQVLEGLFPGLADDLVAGGAPHGDALADTRLYFSGHRMRKARAGLPMLSVSRPFLEGHVRARVRSLPNVTFAPPCDIVGLAATPGAGRVTGARVFRRVDGSTAEVLDADLVVDATGRGSRAPRWLQELGFEPPEEERVEVDVSYATCLFRLPPDALAGDLACLQAPTPESPRGGALARLEAGRWMLTLTGVLGDRPPTDPAGFLEFARSLRFPDIADAVGDSPAAGTPVAYRFAANLRRRYERLSRFPDGFLVVGDGVCSFNPVYGQGMTVAALEAVTLDRHLREHPTPRPRRFLRDLARVVDVPWQMATGADLTFPGVAGRRTRRLRAAGAYLTRLHAAAAHDATLATTFLRVSGLVESPGALIRPGVAVRVLRDALGRRPARVRRAGGVVGERHATGAGHHRDEAPRG